MSGFLVLWKAVRKGVREVLNAGALVLIQSSSKRHMSARRPRGLFRWVRTGHMEGMFSEAPEFVPRYAESQSVRVVQIYARLMISVYLALKRFFFSL